MEKPRSGESYIFFTDSEGRLSGRLPSACRPRQEPWSRRLYRRVRVAIWRLRRGVRLGHHCHYVNGICVMPEMHRGRS